MRKTLIAAIVLASIAPAAADERAKITAETGKRVALVRVLTGHTDWARTLAFSPDGQLASGSRDNSIRLWKTTTGEQPAKKLDNHTA